MAEPANVSDLPLSFAAQKPEIENAGLPAGPEKPRWRRAEGGHPAALQLT